MSKSIYLDHNACTPVAPSVIEAICHYLKETIGNPSSVHRFGRRSKSFLTMARDLIAGYLKVRPDEIIFTSGGTEGANLVIRGLFDHGRKGHIITSSAEHSCVYQTIKQLEKQGVSVTYLDPGVLGAPTGEQVQAAIRPETCLIALMAVNNETGVKTDIEDIAQIAQLAQIPLFVDAVALLGKEEMCIPAGVAAMSFSGHKIHATNGIGFCYIQKKMKLTPLIAGGGQQYGRRSGTENMAGIVGLAEAVRLLSHDLPEASARMKALRDRFEALLKDQLADVEINGEGPRVGNTSNLSFIGVDGETLLQQLDLCGVAASHGSACSSGALEPSRVLVKMGLPQQRVRSAIRFSFSRFTKDEEVEEAAEIVIRLVNELRNSA